MIDCILTNCHEMPGTDFASLVPSASRVEQVQADDPEAPRGLSHPMATLEREMADHMTKEEMILFPAIRAGGGTGIEHPIAVMRAEHEDQAENIALIRRLTHDLMPPEQAFRSWRSLCGGRTMLLEELAAHIALENDMLFPRFEPAT